MTKSKPEGTKNGLTPLLTKGTLFHTVAHFANDFFLSFFAPTLPVLITQMGLLKVQAGILNLGLELTALSMPLIGKIADRKDIRKYMVMTPAITALCMTSLGNISNFYLLLGILLVGGFSIYFYHAIGPADVANLNEQALGRLMAIWNIAGQVAFMIGPLVVTWVITRFSVHQLPFISIMGFAFAVGMFFMQKNQNPAVAKRKPGHQVHHKLLTVKSKKKHYSPIFTNYGDYSVHFAFTLMRLCVFTCLYRGTQRQSLDVWNGDFPVFWSRHSGQFSGRGAS